VCVGCGLKKVLFLLFLGKFRILPHLHLGALCASLPKSGLEGIGFLGHGLALGWFLEGAANGRCRLVDVLQQ